MKLNFINTLPCELELRYDIGEISSGITLEPNDFITEENLPANEKIMILKAIAKGENCSLVENQLYDIDLGKTQQKSSYSILIAHQNYKMVIFRMNKEEQIEKSSSGDPLVG